MSSIRSNSPDRSSVTAIKIVFHINSFSEDNYASIIYDYAHYNEEMLHNQSIIVFPSDYKLLTNFDENVFNKFTNRFNMTPYSSKEKLEEFLKEKNITIFYNLKSGENDNFVFPSVKTVSHCFSIYSKEEKHGNVYIPISPVLVSPELRSITPFIPPIVHPIPDISENLREFLKIPSDSIVFGRYGEQTDFNIPFVGECIKEIAESNPNIFFIFLNTPEFTQANRNLIYLKSHSPSITDRDKTLFINTCNAMIYSKERGESLSQSIIEFISKNKYILTYKNNTSYTSEVLGNSCLYYEDKYSLKNLILNFNPSTLPSLQNYNSLYTPTKVMELFNKYIINTQTIPIISSITRNNKKFFYINNKNIKNKYSENCKKLIDELNPSRIVHIGAGVGYNTFNLSQLEEQRIIAIESNEESFNLLKSNIVNNNINNVIPIYYTESIDSLFINEQSLSLLKIDVKDNIPILKGAIKTIFRTKPFIILNSDENNTILISLLNVIGYSLLKINEGEWVCFPKSQSESILDRSFPKDSDIDSQLSILLSKINKTILYTKEIRVKILCNWTTGYNLCRDWNKMSKGDNKWNNIKLVSDDNDIDYYVIINKPRPGDYYIPSRTMVFRMEPDTSTGANWNDWYKSKRDFLYFFNLENYRNNSEWHLGLTYKQLNENCIPKTKVISSVISSLYAMEGHRKRVDFVKYCQSRGLPIDVFGRDNLHNLKNHKGELPYHNKNEGILPYKYNFIAENCRLQNYFTEKIIDSILGESLCFYWGCPNIENFIDKRAYILLDLDDMESSYKKVVECINNDEWSKRLPYILEEKDKILSHYSFFPRIEGYILLSKLNCMIINEGIDIITESCKREDFYRYSIINKIPDRELWKNIQNDTLILQNTSSLSEGFNDKLAMYYRELKEKYRDFDILLLEYNGPDIEDENKMIGKLKTTVSFRDSSNLFDMMLSYGYIISEEGAKKLYNMSPEEINTYYLRDKIVCYEINKNNVMD